jgi:hypothetical protein
LFAYKCERERERGRGGRDGQRVGVRGRVKEKVGQREGERVLIEQWRFSFSQATMNKFNLNIIWN